jgi:hypothetical protein
LKAATLLAKDDCPGALENWRLKHNEGRHAKQGANKCASSGVAAARKNARAFMLLLSDCVDGYTPEPETQQQLPWRAMFAAEKMPASFQLCLII